jgi:hypothetical protein
MTRPTSDDLSPPSAHEAAIRALLLQGQHGGVASFTDADIARTVIALRVATPSSIRDEMDLSSVENVALDEMFSQGRPVFGGIDVDDTASSRSRRTSATERRAWDDISTPSNKGATS